MQTIRADTAHALAERAIDVERHIAQAYTHESPVPEGGARLSPMPRERTNTPYALIGIPEMNA
jgi:hypothetical protein